MAALVVAACVAFWPQVAIASFVNFESQHVHPIALTPDGGRLLVVNTPDARLAVFDVLPSGLLAYAFEASVGLEPVSVAARSTGEAWVVNHVSDSISIVDLNTETVTATMQVGDEPTDVVFAGGRAFVCVSQRDLILILDPTDLAAPPIEVPIFASDPQALAVSPDGQTVYASILEGNNQTTIASLDDVLAHGGLPDPNPPGRPDASLILKRVGGTWVDELGRSYNDTHPYTVVDHDVAVLDATVPVPAPVYYDGLGTINFNLAVHPTSGAVYVTNIDAQNHIRFEPELRGQFIRTRLSIVDPGAPATPDIVDLNPHINYSVSPGPASEVDLSLSTPGAMVFAESGSELFMTALGSGTVAVLDPSGAVQHRIAVDPGPSGLALDDATDRLYVAHRFTNSVTVIDASTRAVVAEYGLFDPSSEVIKNGRQFLYDGRTSGHGDASCASCHIGANLDAIAWDLGDPDGEFQPPPPGQPDPLLTGFHPMKGPMTTQTLRGLAGTEPLHWRGDRADFNAFNPAFVGLLGLADELPAGDMQAFTDFILTVVYPPNPNLNLDRSLPDPPGGPSATRGEFVFDVLGTSGNDPTLACVICHFRPTGTNGRLTNAGRLMAAQDMKVSQLRNMYEKTGFSMEPGTHKRGFGFLHDGSNATLIDFLSGPRFDSHMTEDDKLDLEAFMLAWDTGMAPAVGAQETADAVSPDFVDWLDTMVQQHEVGNAELIVKGRQAELARGWVYDGAGRFRPDRAAEPLVTRASLLGMIGAANPFTFTGVPPGCGVRAGIDRDEDGHLDRDEIDAGSNPADPLSTPDNIAVADLGLEAVPALNAIRAYPNPAPASGAWIAFELGQTGRARVRIFSAVGRLVAEPFNAVAAAGPVVTRWDGRTHNGQRAASGRYYFHVDTGGAAQAGTLMLVR